MDRATRSLAHEPTLATAAAAPPAAAPPPLDLVLVGGGHAHVHVVKAFGSSPALRALRSDRNVRCTLVSRDDRAPYSGMLPGYVSGHYGIDEMHLDLRKLCRRSGFRFVRASATGATHRRGRRTGSGGGEGEVRLDGGRPPIRYDAVSFDVGSAPAGWGGGGGGTSSSSTAETAEVEGVVTPVKPIAGFAGRYEALRVRLRDAARRYDPENPFVFLVVGGGAGGVELALSAQHSLSKLMEDSGAEKGSLKVTIATSGRSLLESHNSKVRRIFRRIMDERGIEVHYDSEATGVECCSQEDDDNGNGSGTTTTMPMNELKLSPASSSAYQQLSPIRFHECLWCTSAKAAPWLSRDTPFETTPDGFLKVEDTYQCANRPGAFAAGDCCHMVNHPRPKAGVFAVRAGPPLCNNLAAYLAGKPLKPHRPQSNFLGLISTGDKYAVASRGRFALEGSYLWKLKDRIDRNWMKGYVDLPTADDDGDGSVDEVG